MSFRAVLVQQKTKVKIISTLQDGRWTRRSRRPRTNQQPFRLLVATPAIVVIIVIQSPSSRALQRCSRPTENKSKNNIYTTRWALDSTAPRASLCSVAPLHTPLRWGVAFCVCHGGKKTIQVVGYDLYIYVIQRYIVAVLACPLG